MAALQFGIYGICLVAVLPHVGPFVASLRRNPANLMLVLLFTTLAMSTAAAIARVPSPETTLQAKALAATAVWALIYIVTFSSIRTGGDLLRVTRWISSICLVITASGLSQRAASRLGTQLRRGPGVQRRDVQGVRAAGRQRGLSSGASHSREFYRISPIMFGVHLGALLLTATRGAVLCLAVGLLAYLLILASGRIRSTGNRMRWSVAAVAVGCVVWLSPVSAVLMGRLSDPSLRLMAMEMGIRAVQENPVLGGASTDSPTVDPLLPKTGPSRCKRRTACRGR